MRRITIIVLIIILFVAIYFTNFYLEKQRSAKDNFASEEENQILLAQIQQLEKKNCVSSGSEIYIPAEVFSTYPFNIKSKITVDVGKNQGIKSLAPVILGKNILVGQITEVFDHASVVRTVFDPDWKLPVRIGNGEIDGLLQGGSVPRVVLIAKEKSINVGDVVYSADSSFPYGLKIGEITEVSEKTAGVFKEAGIKMPFNITELREVNVMK